jgi:hypothetical protein
MRVRGRGAANICTELFCFFEPNFDTLFCAIFPPLQLTAQGATAVNNSAFA